MTSRIGLMWSDPDLGLEEQAIWEAIVVLGRKCVPFRLQDVDRPDLRACALKAERHSLCDVIRTDICETETGVYFLEVNRNPRFEASQSACPHAPVEGAIADFAALKRLNRF